MKLVILDPGHGGHDPGATTTHEGKIVTESALNLRAARVIHNKLTMNGIHCLITRCGDDAVPLSMRRDVKAFIPVYGAHKAYFISIHHNAWINGLARGFEIFTNEFSDKSDVLAEHLYTHMAGLVLKPTLPRIHLRTDESDGDPDKEANFTVLMESLAIPAILVEFGFITNQMDLGIILDPDVQIYSHFTDGLVNFPLDGDNNEF